MLTGIGAFLKHVAAMVSKVLITAATFCVVALAFGINARLQSIQPTSGQLQQAAGIWAEGC